MFILANSSFRLLNNKNPVICENLQANQGIFPLWNMKYRITFDFFNILENDFKVI